MTRMLYPRHPKPVVDPRPVATHSIRQEQQVSMPLLAPDRPPDHRKAPRPSPVIRFTVRYGLREYLSVVLDHLPVAVQARGRTHQRIGFLSRLAVALLVTPMFLFKRWRVGDCQFELDANGITRRSRRLPITVSWREATAVHRYRGAYLVVNGRGAMPLPHRCFSEKQRQHFERWIADAGH